MTRFGAYDHGGEGGGHMHADTVPCLLKLVEEFDSVGPARSEESDGSIGDAAHASRSSNHNRDDTPGSSTPQTDSDGNPDIRAVDVTDKGPWLNGFTMQKGVDFIVSRCRSGVENRLVEIIYNGYCWYASNGWDRKTYTGSNPHDKHAHFGAKADSGKLENDRRPWGIAEKWGDMGAFLPKYGDQGEEVKYWQYFLEWLGYDPGDVDGDFGDSTKAALNRWRADHGQANVDNITGWTAATMTKEIAQAFGKPGPAGKNGTNGKDGADGEDGKDGTITGTFTITGGTLEAVDTGTPTP